jgi:RNA polymerase sigma-70 factor, ECF subfamily
MAGQNTEASSAPMTDETQITLLLQRLRVGDREAESQLMEAVYGHLHGLAERRFMCERQGHTLQPTALLSELYLRIIRDSSVAWQSRAHFFAIAAATIRRILVDHARAANAVRRPDRARRVQIEDVCVYSDDNALEMLIIDEALTKLRSFDERQAKVVELRCFGGLSVAETAEMLGIAERTVKFDWALARAWLSNILNQDRPDLPKS